MDFCGYVSSDGSTRYFKILNVSDATVDTGNLATSVRFDSNTFYRFRMVANESGSSSYYYSTDDGETYVRINDTSNSSNTDNDVYFSSSQHDVPTRHRNVVAHQYSLEINPNLTNIPQLGVVEWQTGATGKLVSAVIDLGDNLYW